MWLLRRLSRIPALLLLLGLFVALWYGVARAAGPHLMATTDAIVSEPAEVVVDLSEGAQRTVVFDANGDAIGVLRYDVDRLPVNLPSSLCSSVDSEGEPRAASPNAIHPDVIATLLVVEDAKFCEHPGFDLRATTRALISNVASGGVSSGGSTITQQIVKLREVGDERSFNRKIKEAVLATRLETQLIDKHRTRILRTYEGDDLEFVERAAHDAAKSELLGFYLNEVYFGNGAYGLQAAAETYFGKEQVSDLDVGDMAFLASLIRSPGVFDGFNRNVQLVARRRSSALQQAVAAGIITPEERVTFNARPLPSANLSPQRTDTELRRDYFLDEVTEALLQHPELGATYQERFAQVYNGGLSVYTTLRPELAAQMDEAIDQIFPDGSGAFEVAIASVDPRDGAVLALRGGPAFTDLQYNLATQGFRQPGSSFKTYVLAAAIERDGVRPHDLLNGRGPCTFPNPPQEDYVVRNFGNSTGKWDTVAAQTLRSSNCSFVRLGLITGLDDVTDVAEDLLGRAPGDELFEYPSVSLGSQEVTVLEQAAAYGTFANGGLRHDPYYISRIEDRDGNVLYRHQPLGRQVVSRETAYLVSSVLQANVTSGTGRRSQLPSGQQSAGKTGTAQDFSDAWFVGFTPQIATAVWMGHPDEKVPMNEVEALPPGEELTVRSGTGGWAPAMIWGAYMALALEGEPLVDLPVPQPPTREGTNLTMPAEVCEVTLPGVPDDLQPFELPCLMVEPDPSTGVLQPLPAAVCDVELPLPDGGTRHERVRCVDVADRLAAAEAQVRSSEAEFDAGLDTGPSDP